MSREHNVGTAEAREKIIPTRFHRHSVYCSVEARSQVRKVVFEEGANFSLVRSNGFDVDKLSSQFEHFHGRNAGGLHPFKRTAGGRKEGSTFKCQDIKAGFRNEDRNRPELRPGSSTGHLYT